VRKLPFMWAPVYFVAFLLVAIPISEVVLAAWPLRFGEVTWRYGTFGMIGQGVMTPLLGLTIMLWAAVDLQQRWVVKVLGVLCLLASVAFAVAIVMFALDTVQMRSAVADEVRKAFDLATFAAFSKHFAGLVGTALLSIVAYRNGKTLGVDRVKSGPEMVVAAGSRSTAKGEQE